MIEQADGSNSPVREQAFCAASADTVAAPPRSDFLARMSHEMRTPLSAILGYAQLMGSVAHSPSAAQRRSLDLILQAGWYLDKLINTTRELALIDSGDLALSLEHVSLAAIMIDCEAVVASQARVRGVRVIFPVFETPCLVLADGIRLQQVLGNLLSAAIERSAVGDAVLVECAIGSPEWIRISISAGVAHEAIAAEDQGICVLLARRLVELMGGAISPDGAGGPGRASWFALKHVEGPMTADRPSIHAHQQFTAADASTANGNAR